MSGHPSEDVVRFVVSRHAQADVPLSAVNVRDAASKAVLRHLVPCVLTVADEPNARWFVSEDGSTKMLAGARASLDRLAFSVLRDDGDRQLDIDTVYAANGDEAAITAVRLNLAPCILRMVNGPHTRWKVEADGTSVMLNEYGERPIFDDVDDGVLRPGDSPPSQSFASTPEPPPIVQPGATDVQSLVMADIAARREFGVAKYGTPLQVDNGRDALNDAYQEVLDLACYLRQEIERRKNEAERVIDRAIIEVGTHYLTEALNARRRP